MPSLDVLAVLIHPSTRMRTQLSIPAIGIDLGGTKTEAILLDTDGSVLARHRRPTPREMGYDSIVTHVVDMIKETADFLGKSTPYSIGIGIPGSLDPVSGLVRNANSICLIGKPLQFDIERLLKHPISIRNDADCFTMAECFAGAGQGYELVFGIIMGTGCGGGLCIAGEVREGPHRIAGEWGHICMDRDGVECYCGNRGCIETLISGSGVEQSLLRESGKRLSMHEIALQARTGDPLCVRTFNRFLDDFGRCVGGLISLLDPDAVILGGGLSNIDELYTSGVENVKKYAFHNGLRTPILKNSLGDSAGVFGAAWIGQSGT